MSLFVYSKKHRAFFRFMERGKPVTGMSEPATFIEPALADKVVEQLATFEGDGEWSVMPDLPVYAALKVAPSAAEAAKKIGVSPTTIKNWGKKGGIGLRYLPVVHSLLAAA